MANFILDVDFVMSKRIQVEAENEEQARLIVNMKILKNPYNFAHSFDSMVGHKIIDVNEDI